MVRFSVAPLKSHNQFGERLRTAREARGLALPEVARRVRLPAKYVAALEVGDAHELPLGSYRRLWARTYAEFLGLPATEADAAYPAFDPVPTQAAPRQPSVGAHAPVAYGRRSLLVAVSLAVVMYLIVQAWHTLLPPSLTLLSPADNLTTFAASVDVSGTTDTGTRMVVNGEVVAVDNRGLFKVSVALAPGLNTVTVVAQKPYTKPVTLVRRVLFSPPAAASPNPTP